ncbi:MAG: PTS sugar transporter subunit IIA [Planctomycetes bacterium]|nr:PTS sugar transporter subunit IIA [Planctomycetota bacterium]
MKLSELIAAPHVLVPLVAKDKWEVLAQIAALPATTGAWPQAMVAPIHQALVARERTLTTGMEHGIAIPHAAVDGVDDLVAVLGLSATGIPFESMDGQPAHIVVGLVIPRSKKLMHIKTLAEIARVLDRPQVRERLRGCRTGVEATDLLRSLESGAQR